MSTRSPAVNLKSEGGHKTHLRQQAYDLICLPRHAMGLQKCIAGAFGKNWLRILRGTCYIQVHFNYNLLFLMKKILVFVILSCLFFTGAGNAQKAERVQRPNEKARIPHDLINDEVLAPLFCHLRESRATIRPQVMALRRQLAAAADEDKNAIKQSIRKLIHSNWRAHREIRRTIKSRIRELRAARND